MALVDLKKLHDDLRKRIQEDAGGFRKYFANRQSHVISINNKDIKEQCKIEMTAREGYKSAQDFKDGVGKTAYNKLIKIIGNEVPIFTKNMLDALKDLKKKKNTWIIDFDKTPPKVSDFVVSVGKEKGGEVFQAFKRDVKANAQRKLIKSLNEWSSVHSRRGKDTGDRSADKTMGAKTGRKGLPASKEIRTKTKNLETGKMEGSNDPFLDLGHEEGHAVGGIRKMAAVDFLQNYTGDQIKANRILDKLVEELNINIDAKTSYSGELDKSLSASFEASSLNKATMSEAKNEVDFLDKRLMKIINELAQEIYGGWEDWESSDSMVTMIEKRTIESLVKGLRKQKGVKVLTRLDTKKQKNSKNKTPRKPYKPKRTRKKGPSYVHVAIARKMRATARKATSTATNIASVPLHLIGLINKNLPNVVEANMGSPRLTSQTGRFASSTKVTDMIQTPQGFPSIGYTYRRDPYEVFEQDSNYDPRRLIDQSIREIAAQFAMGRFYTRRV